MGGGAFSPLEFLKVPPSSFFYFETDRSIDWELGQSYETLWQMNQQISQLRLAASPDQSKVTKGDGLGDQNGGFYYRDSTRFCSEFQKMLPTFFFSRNINLRHSFHEWLHTPMG